MPDWKKSLPGPPPPGDVDQPLMTDPKWADFVRGLVKGVDFGKAGVPLTATDTTIEVKRGPEIRFFTEGSNPGPWEKAKTVTLNNPHRDCTRWRRRYATITYQYHEQITVTVVITYTKNGAAQTWRSDPQIFWLPKLTLTYADMYLYRWKRSSWEEQVPTGQQTIVGPVVETAEVEDHTPPDADDARPDNDSDTPYPDSDFPQPPTTLWFALRTEQDPLERATSVFAGTTGSELAAGWHQVTEAASLAGEQTVVSDSMPLSDVLRIADQG